jgi:hypothetical protein
MLSRMKRITEYFIVLLAFVLHVQTGIELNFSWETCFYKQI